MSVRFDPSQSLEQVETGLRHAAEAAWGADALPEMEPSFAVTAQSIWRLAQEPLEPEDVEP